jgi:hypothetical protein
MNIASISSKEAVRLLLTKVFALLILLIWSVRLYANLGLSQLMQPVFVDTKADRVYWILESIGIIYALLNFQPLSVFVDFSLLMLPLLIIIYPSKKIFPILLFIALSLYFAAYNIAATHQEHTLIGALGVSLLLCFKDTFRFSTMFTALRFYSCFIMTSAAFWKIGRASVFHNGQMNEILKIQHSSMLLSPQESFYKSWIQFLIENQSIADLLWYSAVLLELVFIIGFFTRRADHLLFWAFWLFIAADYLVMGLNFVELGILSLFFLKRFGRYFD